MQKLKTLTPSILLSYSYRSRLPNVLTRRLLQVAKLFSVTLRQNKTLQHLDLAHNELNTPAGIALAGALRTNRNLAFLSVAGNNVGPKAAKALAQTLAENCTLTGVDLSDNSMGVATADGGDPVDVGLALGIGLRRYMPIRNSKITVNVYATPSSLYFLTL